MAVKENTGKIIYDELTPLENKVGGEGDLYVTGAQGARPGEERKHRSIEMRSIQSG